MQQEYDMCKVKGSPRNLAVFLLGFSLNTNQKKQQPQEIPHTQANTDKHAHNRAGLSIELLSLLSLPHRRQQRRQIVDAPQLVCSNAGLATWPISIQNPQKGITTKVTLGPQVRLMEMVPTQSTCGAAFSIPQVAFGHLARAVFMETSLVPYLRSSLLAFKNPKKRGPPSLA